MKIKFYGSAKMVTGSNHLIEADGKKLLLDCGMFQGGKEEELLNYEPFPYNPAEIDYLILSHAHIDHSGRIPKLVKDGFTGKIITTRGTYDLSKIMLLDSASIQESDIEWENKKRKRSGKPLLEPLYTKEDALRSLNQFDQYYYNQMVKLDDTFTFRFLDAGHIIGSSIVELWVTENGNIQKIVFSGDLGVDQKAIIKPPEYIESADYLILESTYGNRVHEKYEEMGEKLIKIIEDTASRGGSVIIPSFAVGRTQEIIYQLNNYYDSDQVEEYKRIPIYVDSPMATEATEAYEKNAMLFNDETRDKILSGDNPFTFPNLRYVETVEESKTLNLTNYPKVIISASGMADAGRIRHHLKHGLWNEKNTILFVGYQAQGSTGRKILDGNKEIKILGETIQIRAKIEELQGLSAHADMNMLLKWVGAIKDKPKKIFLVHGEIDAAENLKSEIENRFNISTDIAELGEVVEIQKDIEDIHSRELSPVNLKETINTSVERAKELFGVFEKQRENEFTEEFIKKNYSEYQEALLDINNRLMKLILMESK